MKEIIVNIATQMLTLQEGDKILRQHLISTGANGAGEEKDSEKTPRGKHIIRAKIGEGAAVGTIFRGRRPTGEIYQNGMQAQYPSRDWILTRILWLSGLEPGKNRLGDVDTMHRYIYIHGSPDETSMGKPGSRGCIRMHNTDLISLFTTVTVGTPVLIVGS
jgi:L,D-transpeptidase YbiS